jgi:hypothetical protein
MQRDIQITFAAAYARYRLASMRFAALPADLEKRDPAEHAREQEIYLSEFRAFKEAMPGTWTEFTDWLAIVLDDEADETKAAISHAKMLLGASPVMGSVDLASLDQAMSRVDQLAAALDIISDQADAVEQPLLGSAVRGLSATLSEQMAGVDAILEPHRRAYR